MEEAPLVPGYYVVSHRHIYVPVAINRVDRTGEVDLCEDRIFLREEREANIPENSIILRRATKFKFREFLAKFQVYLSFFTLSSNLEFIN